MTDRSGLPFDPVQELIDEQVRRAERRDQIRQDEERDRLERINWNQAWSTAETAFDVDSYLELGKVLVRLNAEIWLHWFLVSEPRKFHAELITSAGDHHEILKANTYRFVVLRLLRAAVTQDPGAMENVLHPLQSSSAAGDVQRAVGSSLYDYRSSLWDWRRGIGLPSTPPMSQSELADACKIQLEGFSKSKLSKKVRDGILFTKQLANGNRYPWNWFRHCDSEIHAAMVRLSIEYMKNQKNLVPARSPLAAVWKP